MRARLVERLGLSAAAVSETVAAARGARLRRAAQGPEPAAHRQRPRLGDHRRAPASARRTPARRRHRSRMGEGARRSGALEHAISSDVEEKLVLLLGDPATCPHGNPIPGSHNKAPNEGVALADIDMGPVVVHASQRALGVERRRDRADRIGSADARVRRDCGEPGRQRRNGEDRKAASTACPSALPNRSTFPLAEVARSCAARRGTP